MKIWLNDPKTGEPSTTLSFFALGFTVAIIKLLFAGTTLGGIAMGAFTGVDFAAVVGALGTLYVVRKNSDNANSTKEIQE